MYTTEIAVIGSGFGGLGMAMRLKHAGIDDFLIFERANKVGGVWRDNIYPGAACDVESHLYSFSFAPNPHWSQKFSTQPEIWAYLQHCVEDYKLHSHLRLKHTVTEARWDAAEQRWVLQTTQGQYSARVLILAVGALSAPYIPHLPGLETFAGKQFHSARWDSTYNLQAKRVAVIGTGASAIQFIPQIQALVQQLYVFQRTPAWVVPRGDRPLTKHEQQVFRHFPLAQKVLRAAIYAFREVTGVGFRQPWAMRIIEFIARRHLAAAVADPVLRAKLRPAYTIGCKRILISDDYYPALTQSNVELVTTPIADIKAHAVVDAHGVERAVDTLILGTGFRVTEFPMARNVLDSAGQTLAEAWAGSPKAYLGTTVTGFPNLFFVQGPNSGLGHTSVVYMMEAHMNYILKALHYMVTHQIMWLEPHPEAQAAFVAQVDQRMQQTVWMTGGCASWYIDATGRNSTLWPASTYEFRRYLEHFEPADYHLHISP